MSGNGAPSPAGPPELSVVVVNYNAAAYAIECVRSLLEQELPGEPRASRPEVIVVDSASHPEDRARLQELPEGVETVLLEENRGYAAAANAGLSRARGRFLALMNPDLVVLPGALAALVGHLERNRDVGAVGPRTYMDPTRCIQHPLNRLPRLRSLARSALGGSDRETVRRESLRSTRYSYRYWRAREPLEIEMLSGACLVFPRSVHEEVRGFDESFPLYYEDADWCRRVARRGYGLAYVPRSEIVHFYNISAGRDPEAARAKREASERLYFRRTAGRLASWLVPALEARRARRMARIAAEPPFEFANLGGVDEPPTIALTGGGGEQILEFAGTPTFDYAAATLVRGSAFTFPREVFETMPPTEVFVRSVAPRGFRVGSAWRFHRAEAASARPA